MMFGPKIVVITEGKKGLYTINKNNFLYVMANNVKIVETTGAGDAFASTFLAGIIKNKTIEPYKSHYSATRTCACDTLILPLCI